MITLTETAEEIWKVLNLTQANAKKRIVSNKDFFELANFLKTLPENSVTVEIRMNTSPKGGWSYVGSWVSLEYIGEGKYNSSFGRDNTRGSSYYLNVIKHDKEKVNVKKKGSIGIMSLEDITVI